MRYLALSCDYDGTLASDGRVSKDTLAALERVLASGRKLLLVTGRELDDLLAIFPHSDLFERIVAENGALLYRPASREVKPLAEPPPARFVQALRDRGVAPLAAGRVLVATREPHEATVLEAIRTLGLELQVIFNKGAVMVLPAGVNKASGLAAALQEMGLSPPNVVGVGDAENDHAFLNLCECSVAVANALPLVKAEVDFVTRADHGAGVVELIDELVATDLRERDSRLARRQVLLGHREDGSAVSLRPLGINLLIAGTTGSGKSTLTTGLVERAAEKGYQFCIIDPEGDYGTFENAAVLGTPQRAPTVEEVVQVLKEPRQNAVVNLVGLAIAERPSFMLAFFPAFAELRARTGRPHWLVVDETHHVLPSSWEPAALAFPQQLDGIVRITLDPGLIAPPALASVELLIAVGLEPEATLRKFCQAIGNCPPPLEPLTLEPGEVLFWSRETETGPSRVRFVPGRTERLRHRRKYAEGELPPDRSFFFRGPQGKLRLRAQNLMLFTQLADGLDDETWLYHLHRGEYSRWFRDGIKDEELAAEAAQVEKEKDLSPADSRQRIRQAIEARYTAPANVPLPVPGTAALPRYP